jgi:hypothetical protein
MQILEGPLLGVRESLRSVRVETERSSYDDIEDCKFDHALAAICDRVSTFLDQPRYVSLDSCPLLMFSL